MSISQPGKNTLDVFSCELVIKNTVISHDLFVRQLRKIKLEKLLNDRRFKPEF